MRKAAKHLFKDYIEEWLQAELERGGVENLVVSYAEHPYLTGRLDGFEIDIVLCFSLSREELQKHGPITAVDRTPWHSRFIRDHLTALQRDNVRLFKQFCKAQHAYGDKSAAGRTGFIGYALELLVHHYGDVLTIFEQFDDLPHHAHDVIPEPRSLRFFKNHPRFERDHLIVIDPTDPMRNVAASISRRSFLYVAKRVKDFLEAPSPDFFPIRPIPLASPKTYPGAFFVCEFEGNAEYHYSIPRDKIYSVGDALAGFAHHLDGRDHYFPGVVFELYFEKMWNRYALGFYCPSPELEPIFLRTGPPAGEEKNAAKFRKKHPNAFIQEGRWVVEETREVTNFAEFLLEYLPQRLEKHAKHLTLLPGSLDSLAPLSEVGNRVITVLKEMVLPFEL